MNLFKKHPAIVLGLVISLLFFGVGVIRLEFLDALELKLYDLRMGLRKEKSPADTNEIVLVNIDDTSVENIGRWPWPRAYIAKGIDKIDAAGARIIGLNIVFSEPEESNALKSLENLSERLSGIVSNPTAIQMINETILTLDNDRKLTESIKKSGKVVLPVIFKKSLVDKEETERKVRILKEKNQILQKISKPQKIKSFSEDKDIVIPISPFFESTKGIGHVNLNYDIDGKFRREQLLYEYQGFYVPSFALKIAAIYHNIENNEIEGRLGKSIRLRQLEIPLTSESEFLVSFKGGKEPFKRIPFLDIYYDKYTPKVLKEQLNGKIVLIAPSAAGIQNPISTPNVQSMSLGEFTANVIWAMLHRRFIQKPLWDSIVWLAMTLLVTGVITFVLPRLKALFAGLIFVGFILFIISGSFILFVSKGLWIQITYPLLHLIFGYIGVVSIKYFVTETKKEKIEGESAESNRMLGLSYQSQGMLDMAFEKFRKVPMDDDLKRILYDLARDFERKRLFNKAVSVYEYIEEHDSEYKDVVEKKKRLMQATETMIFGDGFLTGGTQNDGLQLGEGTERPRLGRYEVIKQLGKGAMGVVYLGEDPRINRKTAIKTFRLGDGFEPDEVDALKKKFFREAESAGTLSHPHIVTIYDAGEEQDLAYIAMEFLEGEDLQKYTKKNNLLPMRKVLDHVADIADALDYAHEKGIVHRDIKPANVMLLKTGVVKITDFGIARITATSQTQTGVVKGTPHYMSPEQISGEKVDGRSDIFSLGAMLFQLLTGDVPFHGDSPAALMHQIMNVPHPDPRTLNSKLLKPHVTIIDKAMEKNRSKRYQKASQMSAHLRMLGKKLDEIGKKKA